MILNPVNPDIRSMLAQIDEGEIDLDPEFQRGDVWNLQKRQMLVDTILRGWKIPPIFLIASKGSTVKEVLDGHQRLQSIRMFFLDQFRINGKIEPIEEEISCLDGLLYSQLPEAIKYRFRSFSLNTFEIVDFKENEPYELFYRLNTNVVLTSAERRNTFFGPARDQVRDIVQRMCDLGYSNDSIGFNNTRLGYHDVIARLLFALEIRTINKKINDKDITDRFRMKLGFSESLHSKVVVAVESLFASLCYSGKVKFNKASLFSMLLFYVVAVKDEYLTDVGKLSDFLVIYRDFIDRNAKEITLEGPVVFLLELRQEYGFRISTSVYDSKSVLFRHFCFCFLMNNFNRNMLTEHYQTLTENFESYFNYNDPIDNDFYKYLDESHWGELHGF